MKRLEGVECARELISAIFNFYTIKRPHMSNNLALNGKIKEDTLFVLDYYNVNLIRRTSQK